jgi:hypothetical protein
MLTPHLPMNELLANHGPLATSVFDYVDVHGTPYALVVAKGTWDLVTGKQRTAADGIDSLVPVHEGPVRRNAGDLNLSVEQRLVLGLRTEQQVTVSDHDQTPPKPKFDVIVEGTAHAPEGKSTLQFMAGVAVGTVVTSVRVMAPRYWKKSIAGLVMSEPVAPISSVPLSYAFTPTECSIRLPEESVARGKQLQSASEWQEYVTTIPPWIEAAGRHSSTPDKSSDKQCLGFWPENVSHRLKYVGTYDARWLRDRAPRLPLDFDEKFYNVSDPSLQLDTAPQAYSRMHLVNLSLRGNDHARFPAATVDLVATYCAGVSRRQTHDLRADTLIFAPDLDRMSIVWRTLVPLRGNTLTRMVLNYSGRER